MHAAGRVVHARRASASTSAGSTCSRPSRCARSRASTAAGRSRAPRSTSRCARPGRSLARGARPRAAAGDVRGLAAARQAADDRAGAPAARALPDAALQARPDQRLDRRADRGAGRDRRGRLGRLQGLLQGHGRRPAARPGPLPARGRGVPGRVDRGPGAHRRDAARARAGHEDRITWDAPIHSIADIEALPFPPKDGERQALALRQPAARCSTATTTSPSAASAPTAAASSSSGPGRGQIQYLASLFHPDTPNDVAPVGLQRARAAAGAAGQPARAAAQSDGFSLGLGQVAGRQDSGLSSGTCRSCDLSLRPET